MQELHLKKRIGNPQRKYMMKLILMVIHVDIKILDNIHNEAHKKGGEYLKSAVFGGLDGIITSYSVVMGSLGVNTLIYIFNEANLAPVVVLVLGISNVFGDGIAMAMGDYLSTKSEIEYTKMERQREEWEIENNPNEEKMEIYNLYQVFSNNNIKFYVRKEECQRMMLL